MRIYWVVGLVLMIGCKKDAPAPTLEAPGAPASTKEQDALWALAPEGASFGVVVSPRGIELAERGVAAIRAVLDSAPELAPVRDKLVQALTDATGSPSPTLADFGVAHDQGAALFITASGAHLAILPVGDRDKFLAKIHGTKGAAGDTVGTAICTPTGGRYVCAEHREQLAGPGRADLLALLRPAGARGEIEVVAHEGAGGDPVELAMVAQLQRGAFVVHGSVTANAAMLAKVLGSPSKPRDTATAAGFGVIDLTPYLAALPPVPLASGVTAADLGRSIAGPLSFSVAAGTTDLDVRVPLNDPSAATTIIEHCAALPPLASVGATFSDGTCHVPIAQLGLTLDGWVEGKELRIGRRGAPIPTRTIPQSPIGGAIAGAGWSIAMYGRGSLFASVLPPAMATQLPAEAKRAMRAVSAINELGVAARRDANTVHFLLGVRTIWANPDDVVAKLFAIPGDQLLTAAAVTAARAIADAAPGSPFAADLQAGVGGGLIFAPTVGIVAAVAIPAFMDYMKRSKKPEAAFQLGQIGKRAKRAYAETSAFPVGTTTASPSAASCCAGPNLHCAVNAAAWQQPVWKALDFQIDEPSLFRYAYQSDGKTFTATATGDLDCDGIEIVYTLTGTSDGGVPRVQLTEPAPNSD